MIRKRQTYQRNFHKKQNSYFQQAGFPLSWIAGTKADVLMSVFLFFAHEIDRCPPFCLLTAGLAGHQHTFPTCCTANAMFRGAVRRKCFFPALFPQPAFLPIPKDRLSRTGNESLSLQTITQRSAAIPAHRTNCIEQWHIRPFLRDSSIHAAGKIAHGGEVDLLKADSEAYWQLAASIYASALAEEAHLMIHQGDSLLFLLDQEERKRAEQVLFDYFRLVGCN